MGTLSTPLRKCIRDQHQNWRQLHPLAESSVVSHEDRCPRGCVTGSFLQWRRPGPGKCRGLGQGVSRVQLCIFTGRLLLCRQPGWRWLACSFLLDHTLEPWPNDLARIAPRTSEKHVASYDEDVCLTLLVVPGALRATAGAFGVPHGKSCFGGVP